LCIYRIIDFSLFVFVFFVASFEGFAPYFRKKNTFSVSAFCEGGNGSSGDIQLDINLSEKGRREIEGALKCLKG
jgi:hypothetical protein